MELDGKRLSGETLRSHNLNASSLVASRKKQRRQGFIHWSGRKIEAKEAQVHETYYGLDQLANSAPLITWL